LQLESVYGQNGDKPSVIKATTENKTSSVTHFKKLTTGNNVFIVSVIF